MHWILYWKLMSVLLIGMYLLLCNLNWLFHKVALIRKEPITRGLKFFTVFTGFAMLSPYCALNIAFPSLRTPSIGILIIVALVLPFVLPTLRIMKLRRGQ